MGKILTIQNMPSIVEKTLQSYTQFLTERYTILFNRSPTFSTYYSKDLAGSMYDTNLGGEIEPIGFESPSKFQRIADFPLYGFEGIDLSRTYDEITGHGTETVQGEIFILPGTLEPLENDYFKLNYINANLLFRITNVQVDRIEGKTFFKISWLLVQESSVEIESQVSERLSFEIANLGTNHKPIIKEDVFLAFKELDLIIEYFKETFWNVFFNKDTGMLLLKSNLVENPIHSRSVDSCLRRNKLMEHNGYRKGRTFNRIGLEENSEFEREMYPYTMYWLAEKGDALTFEIVTNKTSLSIIQAASPIIFDINPLFYSAIPPCEEYPTAMPNNSPETIGDPDIFIDAINKNFSGYENLDLVIRKIFALSYRDDTKEPRDLINLFIEDINKEEVFYDLLKFFFYAPIIFMEYSHMKNKFLMNN